MPLNTELVPARWWWIPRVGKTFKFAFGHRQKSKFNSRVTPLYVWSDTALFVCKETSRKSSVTTQDSAYRSDSTPSGRRVASSFSLFKRRIFTWRLQRHDCNKYVNWEFSSTCPLRVWGPTPISRLRTRSPPSAPRVNRMLFLYLI